MFFARCSVLGITAQLILEHFGQVIVALSCFHRPLEEKLGININDFVSNIDGIAVAEGAYLVFFLNVCCAVVFPTIPSSTFLPTCCAQSQFTVASAVIPKVILCSVDFPPNSFFKMPVNLRVCLLQVLHVL